MTTTYEVSYRIKNNSNRELNYKICIVTSPMTRFINDNGYC